jgi:hypothetical protein
MSHCPQVVVGQPADTLPFLLLGAAVCEASNGEAAEEIVTSEPSRRGLLKQVVAR